MRVIVTGAGGLIGGALVKRLAADGVEVLGTTRRTLDLLSMGDLSRFQAPDVLYLCAAKTRFIDCENDPTAWRINVDSQIDLASQWPAIIVFLSSEAVERALHTNYGAQKAFAEMGLRYVCNPRIARICGKVSEDTLPSVINWLSGLKDGKPGVYRWVP